MKKYHVWVLGLILTLLLSGCGVVVIEDGETGVKADFGKIQDEPLGTGWHWFIT